MRIVFRHPVTIPMAGLRPFTFAVVTFCLLGRSSVILM